MRYGHSTLNAMIHSQVAPVRGGSVSLVVARHEAPAWPSPEVNEYAAQRSRLVHQLDHVDGVTVEDFGFTDAERPNEIVEIIVAVVPAAISALATIIVAWIALPKGSTRKRVPEESVAGIRLRRADGTDLSITFRDDSTKKERLEMVRAALRA